MQSYVAVVTGGASGMGKIFALRMANQGYNVAVIDKDTENLKDMQSSADNIHSFPCDVSDLEQVTQTLEAIKNKLGAIDRLVHCAAIMPTSPLHQQDPRQIKKIMDINYGGTINVTQTILTDMLSRDKGELIVFGSTGGSVLVPDCGAYCASKAATNAYVEVLIEENRHSHIHLMLVCPPLVDTPLLQQAQQSSNPKALHEALANKRCASPEFIIDEVEKALKKGTKILLPGRDAKTVMLMRRLFPRLLWNIVLKANRNTVATA